MDITVKKGRHYSTPIGYQRFSAKQQEIDFSIALTQSMAYDLGDHDQKDWNKLFGVKEYFFQPHRRTCMVGWRYDPASDMLEFNTYAHDKAFIGTPLNRYMGPVQYRLPLSGNVGERLSFKIVRSKDAYHTWIGGAEHHLALSPEEVGAGWMIRHYFGGNRTAPQDITIGFWGV